MIKNDLREAGFSAETRNPKQSKINIIWAIITMFMIIMTILFMYMLTYIIPMKNDTNIFVVIIDGIMESFSAIGYLIFLVLSVLLYLILKFIITTLFCYGKNNVKLKILEKKGIPICSCKEALKVWQTILVYCIPSVLIYILILLLCFVDSDYFVGFTMLLLFFAFYTSFDLTLVAYMLYIKFKEGIDYISIDYHIYEYTLFRKSYVRANKKAKKLLEKGVKL